MTDDAQQRWQRETYDPAVRRVPERKPAFPTESGIDAEPLYGPDDADESNLGYPGEYPFTRGVQPIHVPWAALDDAPVRGLLDAGGLQRPLPLPALAGADRPLGRVRPPDADRLRRRPRHGPRGDRQGRRAHIQPRGHGGAVRRHPARRSHHVHDHQRHRADAARALSRRRAQAGRAVRGDRWHDAERRT